MCLVCHWYRSIAFGSMTKILLGTNDMGTKDDSSSSPLSSLLQQQRIQDEEQFGRDLATALTSERPKVGREFGSTVPASTCFPSVPPKDFNAIWSKHHHQPPPQHDDKNDDATNESASTTNTCSRLPPSNTIRWCACRECGSWSIPPLVR